MHTHMYTPKELRCVQPVRFSPLKLSFYLRFLFNSGCKGNGNNFVTQKECETKCQYAINTLAPSTTTVSMTTEQPTDATTEDVFVEEVEGRIIKVSLKPSHTCFESLLLLSTTV